MATKDKFNALIEIQEKIKKYSFDYKGVCLWPFLRIIIGYNEDLGREKYSKKEVDSFFKSGFRKEFDSFVFFRNFSRNFKRSVKNYDASNYLRRDVLLLSNDFQSVQSPGKAFFNEWMSPLEYCLKRGPVSSVESFFVQGVNQNACLVKSENYDRILDLNISRKAYQKKSLAHFKSIIGIKKQVKDVDGMKELFYLLEQSSLGLTISIDQLTVRVEMLLLLIKDFVSFFTVNPTKTLMVYAFYSDVMLAAVHAARSLGITVIDVQHGLIGPCHFAYSKWNGFDKKKLMFIPDYCFTWDSEITRFINESSGSVCRAYCVGNLSMAYKTSIAQHEINSYKGVGSTMSRHVLITAGAKTLPNQIIDLINKELDVFWHLKLHPRYTSKEQIQFYQKVIFNQKAKVYCGNEIDLYQLFTLCQIHITEESTVAIESEQFGLKNIIIAETGKDMFENYIQDRRFLYCNFEDTEGLVALIENQSNYVKKPTSIENSIEEIIVRINTILKAE